MHDELFEKLDIVARYWAGPDARSRENAQGVRGLVPKAECHGVLALAVASQICGAGLHNSTEHRSGNGSAPHIGLRHIPNVSTARGNGNENAGLILRHSATASLHVLASLLDRTSLVRPQRSFLHPGHTSRSLPCRVAVKTGPLGPPKAWS
jgi:hypothetical protein